MRNKEILFIKNAPGGHWVGDGFPVVSMFSYRSYGEEYSPFLLLDYAGPLTFEPSDKPRGVEKHPHRGFETVTIVYQGEVEHRDNAGHSGKIGPGDVQWMTAARGILHEEMHSHAFTQSGGTLEMIQLWVNLPAKDKMSAPKYQEILNQDIPVIKLHEDGSQLRLIAGQYGAQKGAAQTFTPINLWDIKLKAGKTFAAEVPDNHNGILLVLEGHVTLNGQEDVQEKELALFTRDGNHISFHAARDSTLLFMSGEPIQEPIVGQGPFVMNTPEEIKQAIKDYTEGKF